MKFESVERKDRLYVGRHWNKLYLRNIKAILNVTKGVFGGDRSFFEKAFGRNEEEYIKILCMPKELLTYRFKYEKLGITKKWERLFDKLTDEERKELIDLASESIYESNNKKINGVLAFYKTSYYTKLKLKQSVS